MKNSHVWCCNVADLIQHFFQLLYIKNKSRAAANSRGCRVLRECWYFLVDKLKTWKNQVRLRHPSPSQGRELSNSCYNFWGIILRNIWVGAGFYSDLSPATVPATPRWGWVGEEQSQVTDSETETQRGGHCPQAVQEVGVGEQTSHGSWACA